MFYSPINMILFYLYENLKLISQTGLALQVVFAENAYKLVGSRNEEFLKKVYIRQFTSFEAFLNF